MVYKSIWLHARSSDISINTRIIFITNLKTMFTRKYYKIEDSGIIIAQIVIPNEMRLETIEEELEGLEPERRKNIEAVLALLEYLNERYDTETSLRIMDYMFQNQEKFK